MPNSFNLGSIGQESSLMDMLDIASGQLDFGPVFGGNANIKADYGGKKSELTSI